MPNSHKIGEYLRLTTNKDVLNPYNLVQIVNTPDFDYIHSPEVEVELIKYVSHMYRNIDREKNKGNDKYVRYTVLDLSQVENIDNIGKNVIRKVNNWHENHIESPIMIVNCNDQILRYCKTHSFDISDLFTTFEKLNQR